jgi:5-methylcytosine-specific restriction endonuclease McrA
MEANRMTKRASEFDTATKRAAWDRCGGQCEGKVNGVRCFAFLLGRRNAFDHILPVALGGKSVLANCQVLCKDCHDRKTAKDVGHMAKADRQKNRAIHADKPHKQKIKSNPTALKSQRRPKHEGREPTAGLSEIGRRFGVK